LRSGLREDDLANNVQQFVPSRGDEKLAERIAGGLEMSNIEAPAWTRPSRTYVSLFLATVAVSIASLTVCSLFTDRRSLPLIATISILVAVLVRNELFLSALYSVLVKSSRSPRVPIAIKNGVTSGLLHIGGIHAGCGVASLLWLAVALADLPGRTPDHRPWTAISLAGALLVQLSGMCVLAIPTVRRKHHNLFEYSHRLLGWSALLTLWAFVLVTINSRTTNPAGGLLLLDSASTSPELWLTAVATGLILAPWLTVRKVRVRCRVPSPAVVEIAFPGGSRAGTFGRISRHALSDWHSFALVSTGRLAASHKMLISRAGDFTNELVNTPPSALYVRRVCYPGLPYCVSMYRRSIIIASGAGMAPYVSMLSDQARGRHRLIWIGRSFRECFGDEFCNTIFRWPDLLLVDTASSGRPNLVALAVNNYRSFGADAVFIGSNPKGTRQILAGCHALGIPAFGPSWDS
jgi:hypothetical protein